MTTQWHHTRGLFRTLSVAVVLWLQSSGLIHAQPSEIKIPQPELIAPPIVAFPEAGGVYGTAILSDPVSRVPNFFGDFIARPSFGFVNQPRISTPGTGTTVSTSTLAFLGLPVDVAGGTGANTFYSPFIVGPGGPYKLSSNVTGFNAPLPPPLSVLQENAELTAKINAKFPGATYVSGIGLLAPPFPLAFEYLLTTTQAGTPGQNVPGLVALVNLANPSGGGTVGRNRYFDDGSPVPRDRVFFDYHHVGAFNALGTTLDINRYVFGVEKTFFNGFGSVQVLVPFAGTMNSDQPGGQALAANHVEFGNVGLLLKGTLFRNANWLVSAGMGVSAPTADDSRVLYNGRSVLEIRNHAWLLQPILGAVWAPNDRFYAQGGLQFDFDPNGNPVYVRSPGGEFSQRGVLTDQTYLYASGAVGYWLYQSDTNFLSRVSLQGELHYNRTLGNRDFVQTGSVLVTDLNSNIDVLNATIGVNFVLRDQATLALGVSCPVSGERLYDWNLMARINVPFGRVSR